MALATGRREEGAHDRRHTGVRVALADENYLVRAGIRGALGNQRAFRVVAETADPAELSELCARHDVDLAVVGLDSVSGRAIAALTRLRHERPALRLVALCRGDDADAILAALRAGVDGCVSRDAGRRDLVDVLHRAASGTAAIEPALGATLLRRLADEATAAPVIAPAPLTAREREILRMMARGQTNRQIASRLVLAVGTVKIHVEHILAKLNVPDRTAAAVRGVELGLVELDASDELRRRVGSS